MRLHQDPALERASRFALLVLLYLEEIGVVPERFTPARQATWHGLMPYSRDLDLFELAVRDGARANPHLFAAFREAATRNELRALAEHHWRQELHRLQDLHLSQMPARQLYLLGAETLGLGLPPVAEGLLQDHSFDRSSLIAELPNGCGYPSLLLCEAYDVLDAAHNLRIFVDSMDAEMLAAWAMTLLTRQLTPSPDRILPVSTATPEILGREMFDAALVYRPVPWLSPLMDTIPTREFITL